MKKIYTLLVSSLLLLLFSCAPSTSDKTVRIGVSFFPMPNIVDLLVDDMAASGYELIKVEFLNYAEANPALKNGELEGNLIQHKFYMEVFNSTQNANLVIAQPVYHSIFTLYSKEYSTIEEIPNGETVIIPSDGVNTARALLLLQSAGLITLAQGKTTNATTADVVDNPKNLVFQEASLTAAAGIYDEGGRKLAVMYPTYARSLNLEGDEEQLYNEELNELTEQYPISFATRTDLVDHPGVKRFIELLTSDKVKNFLQTEYGWAAIPAF